MLSMTGYGRCRVCGDGREITVEIKSVNHRFLDLNFRTPKELSFTEEPLRAYLTAGGLKRGHVEVTLSYLNSRSDTLKVHIDPALLSSFRAAVKEVSGELDGFAPLTAADVLNLSGACTTIHAEEDAEAVNALALQALEGALSQLNEMRKKEGAHLKADLLAHLESLKGCREVIALRAPEVPKDYRKKLCERLKELQCDGVEEQRLAQEVALMADRCAIDEELSRLDSHIRQFATIMENEAEVGRKLDFLIQEMNREVNTIGSKANDLAITEKVVEGKSIIEKMREQVQNAL